MRRRQTVPRLSASPVRGRREAPFTRAVYRAELSTAGIVLLVAGAGLLVALAIWFALTDVDRDGVRTTGEVVRVYEPRRGPAEIWVTYRDQAGTTYQRHQYLLGVPDAVGDSTPISYRADRPADSRATVWTPVWPLVVLFASLLVAGTGVAMAGWARHEYRRQARERGVPAGG